MSESLKTLLLASGALALVFSTNAKATELDFGADIAAASPTFGTTVIDGIADIGGATENWGTVITTEIGGVELTDKTDVLDPVGERGLGVTSVAGGCTDTTCEALPGQGVQVTGVAATKINDAIIDSIQAGESFNFFVNGTQVNSSPITNACNSPNFSAISDGLSCLWTDPSGLGVDSIEVVDATGSVALAAVSSPAVVVPAPEIGGGWAGLVVAGALAGFSLLRKFV